MTANSEHARLLRLATRASVTVAGILIVTKAVAWWLSGSVSMLAGPVSYTHLTLPTILLV